MAEITMTQALNLAIDEAMDQSITEVLEKINEGYDFLGGASNGGDWGGYTQTMIKYEE